MVASIIQLKCQCNNYPWGKQGKESLAATLCAKTTGTDFKIEDKPYAEMWMGTYPVLPSLVLETGEDLQDVLDKNQDLLGQQYISKFGHTKISFLPKILSIAKALTLQVHPNKELSAKLHAEKPDQFTDPNHKPEIAVALSDFEAFCGWKPLEVIREVFKLEPLRRYLPSSVSASNITDDNLKAILRNILLDSDSSIASVQSDLRALSSSTFPSSQQHIPTLLPRLQAQYDKTDPGILVALFCMNYLQLPAGKAIYIPADGVHAYLSGDIIECMARSNNVLNTGFCPRADRDNIDVFTNTLSFGPHSVDEVMLPEQKFEKSKKGKTTVFAPPISEFNILLTQLGSGEEELVDAIAGPSIMIVTKGGGVMEGGKQKIDLEEGYVYFVGQGVPLSFEAKKGKEGLQIWRAYCE